MGPPHGRRLVALALHPSSLLPALEEAWTRGDAVLPVDPALPAGPRDRLLAALRPAVLVTPYGTTQLPEPAPTGEDVALVVATAGSTGVPKGVELSQRALESATRAGISRVGATSGEPWLCCLPTHHIGGLQVLLRARLCGSPLVVHDRFSAERVATERDVRYVSLVPTMLQRLLDAGANLTHLRAVLLGGAPSAPSLLRAAADAGIPVVRTYGMTETAGGCVYDGVPLDGVDVALGPDGGVRLRGPVLARGYRLRPDLWNAAFRDGWLHTADVGRWTPGGRLEVLGRRDDVIVTGGEKVVATHVAGELSGHPDVAEVAVLGRFDREWGQRVVAVVVPADPARPPALAALREWLRERLAAPALPRELVVLPALPRLPTGKLDRASLLRLVVGQPEPLPASSRSRPSSRSTTRSSGGSGMSTSTPKSK